MNIIAHPHPQSTPATNNKNSFWREDREVDWLEGVRHTQWFLKKKTHTHKQAQWKNISHLCFLFIYYFFETFNTQTR